MKRSRQERFKESVEELNNRIDRAENFLDTEKGNMKDKLQQEEKGQEVYRDKNTLVEVTIHRRGSKSSSKISHSHLNDSEAPTYSRPTNSSNSRTVQSKGRERPGVEVGMSSLGGRVRKKSVKDLLEELKEIVDVSGVKDVHDFLENFEKSRPSMVMSSAQKFAVPPPKSPQKSCKKPDHSLCEEKIEALEKDRSKHKSEAARYRQEHGIIQKELDISKKSNEDLEAQIVDFKKIVSRLTRNNSELLGIVSEKINYEDQLAALRQELEQSRGEAERQRQRATQSEQRMVEREVELKKLQALTAELKAGLQHGLAGLQVPRVSPITDVTKDLLLGISQLSDKASESDSAIEDPNTESLKSRAKSRQQQDVPQSHAGQSAPVVGRGKPVPPPVTYGHSIMPRPSVSNNVYNAAIVTSSSEQFIPISGDFGHLGQQVCVRSVPISRTVPVSTATELNGLNQYTNAGNFVSNPPLATFRPPTGQSQPSLATDPFSRPASGLSNLTTSRSPIGFSNPPSSGHVFQPPHTPPTKMSRAPPPAQLPHNNLPPPLIRPQQFSAPTSIQPSPAPQLAQDQSRPRSSTLMEEERPASKFQPVPLDLSETLSATEVDGSKFIPPLTVVENLASQKNLHEKQSLEHKVQDFLKRLHQDYLNLSTVEVPQPKPWAGPSLHLSLSTSDLGVGEETANTTLSEGKFIRGLETSIEVLAAEVSADSSRE